MSEAQKDLLDEIIVDNFAGGGGASTGMELATGRYVKVAVNHDPDAILMHKTNHPHTKHYQESVWDIDPVTVCEGHPVGLAWFSPDCKHFSKAKGGKPVEKSIRGLAWIVLRWAGKVRPRVIILENVEEFQTWGPVRKGKPVKKKAGQTFQKWLSQLRDLGYQVDWRELVAADYGAPTTRRRFFLIARCDGLPIKWPAPTHAPADSPAVLSGELQPWRCAAEIIDWTLPCPSIFDTKAEIKERYGLAAVRPLAQNTQRRVIRGIQKFVLEDADPFLVEVNHGGDFRGQRLNQPLPTVTSKHGYGVVAPALIQYHTEQSERVRAQGLKDPLMTVDASNRYGVAAACLVKYYGNDQHGQTIRDPLHTITAKDREGLSMIHMIKMKGQDIGSAAADPLQTITAGGLHHGVVVTKVERYADGSDMRNWAKIRSLLNTFCDYTLADDEVILFQINSEWYFMADIGLRMLTPKELYRANGFPPDYIIDHDYQGNKYGKSKQVARCGNAVPPPFATALVRANLPEWCHKEITTMAQLDKAAAG